MTNLKDKYYTRKLYKTETSAIYHDTERNRQSFYFDTATQFTINTYIKETQYEYKLTYELGFENSDEENLASNKIWSIEIIT